MNKPKSSLDGKHFLITGITGGAGPVLADGLVNSGAEVSGVYHSEDGLKEAKGRTEKSEDIDYFRADLSREKEAAKMAESLKKKNGSLHGLVNLVGGFSLGDLKNTDGEEIITSFKIHVVTAFLTIKYTSDLLSKTGEGSVVNFTSKRALEAQTGSLSYNIGKTGVAELTRSLDNELRNIRVNALAPDTLDTPANREAMPEGNRENWTGLSELTEITKFLLGEGSKPIHGQIITV